MENEKKYKKIKIILNNYTSTQINFVGFYRRDLEKPNWHYYETKDGNIYHFRKEFMCAVIEDYVENAE